LLSIAFLVGVLTGVAVRDFGEPSAINPSPRMAKVAPAASPWWRTRFPPASVDRPSLIPEVKFDRSQVLPGVSCGSLDGAIPKQGTGVLLWGWAYDPRTKRPAPAVVLFDNGRRLSPPVPVYRERPDVPAALREPALMTSGWNIWLPAASLDVSQEHTFEAFALLEDGKFGQLGGRITVHE
jgi:hypothetical protein